MDHYPMYDYKLDHYDLCMHMENGPIDIYSASWETGWDWLRLQKAIEALHFEQEKSEEKQKAKREDWDRPPVIFNSYVKLPEGIHGEHEALSFQQPWFTMKWDSRNPEIAKGRTP